MTQDDQIRADLAHFNATGELPAAWAPEINDAELDDAEFYRRLKEINEDPEAP